MLKKDIIIRITFSDTETTLLQKQQQNVIQALSSKKLSTSTQRWDFQISAWWAARCNHWMKSNDDRHV